MRPTPSLAYCGAFIKALEESLQNRLINWGYAVCDAALRRHVDSKIPKGEFPYPGGV
jgi:NTE family protein